ncbi:phosphatase PAP2 family protein [Azospirillum sp. B4]|uniref:phosphatase PAP2 family protein n=1 Tax=Azospirillum sp. B4 TaxID=95605 RepID=UPI00034D0DBF|nr:phosphatase PAP2 family protein [Azospirillum sp. B4]
MTRPALFLALGGFLILEAALVLWVDRPFTLWAAGLTPMVRNVSRHLTLAGDSFYSLLPLGLAAIALAVARLRATGDRRRHLNRQFAMVAFVFLAVALSGLAVDGVKAVVGRPRPQLFLTDGSYLPQPFHMGFRYYSFPSGHANTLVALALAAGCLWPRHACPCCCWPARWPPRGCGWAPIIHPMCLRAWPWRL